MAPKELCDTKLSRHPSGDRALSLRFDELVLAERAGLVAAAAAIVGSRHIAEEVVQDAFVRLLRHGGFNTLERPGAWLRTVVVNASIDVVRRQQRESKVIARSHTDVAADVTSSRHDPGESLPDTRLWAAVQALPPEQAKAVALRYAADCSAEEVAEALSTTAAAVNSLLYRARERLRATLDPAPTRIDDASDPTGADRAVDLRSEDRGLA